jgi:hypothetical protein
MAYTKAADGVASKGKTQVKVFPNSGPNASNPKGGKSGKGGPTGENMKAVGRNMARANYQRGR